jgi:ribosomal 30S subunit maturation factor RimM
MQDEIVYVRDRQTGLCGQVIATYGVNLWVKFYLYSSPRTVLQSTVEVIETSHHGETYNKTEIETRQEKDDSQG